MKLRMTLLLSTLCIAAALLFSTTALAQATIQQSAQQPAAQQLGAQTLKPQMAVGDAAFVLNMLNQVNITGGEVDAFLEVKNVFATVLTQAQKDRKKEDDVIVVEMSYAAANNLLQLMQRATIPGSQAERIQGVKAALQAADKANQGKQR